MKTSPKTIAAIFSALLVHNAAGATSDFTRTATADFNGHEGVTFVRYSKGGTPRGFAFAFDLSKGYRFRAWLGDTGLKDAERATVGEMAEQMCTAGLAPIAGINGDYFRTDTDVARPGGLVIADSRLVHSGWSVSNSTDYCYIAGLGDGNLYHGRLDCAAGYPGGDPTASWQVNALGKKVRNAVRTNYQNYPVRAGTINPVGGGDSVDGYVFSTTIGNYQSRSYYWRTLVGIGTNAVGVATNLVLFTSDGSAGFPDVDAYQMMIDLGCNEVGELDGGGSAQMWAEAGEDAVFRGAATARGGYVMKPRDTSPIRPVANGIFVLPPASSPPSVEVGDGNLYPDLDEALLAYTQYAGDSLGFRGQATVSSTNAVAGRTFAMADPGEAALLRSVAEPSLTCEAEAVGSGLYRLGWSAGVAFGLPWFSADASSGNVEGGAWVSGNEGAAPALSNGTWRASGESPAVFAASSPRDGVLRVQISLSGFCGHLEGDLPGLLSEAVAGGERASLAVVEEDDGTLTLRGLAVVSGQPSWVELTGAVLDHTRSAAARWQLAAEFDLTGEVPMVSYMAGGAPSAAPVRLTFAGGAAWLPANGFDGGSPSLSGRLAFDGAAEVASLLGLQAGAPSRSTILRFR